MCVCSPRGAVLQSFSITFSRPDVPLSTAEAATAPAQTGRHRPSGVAGARLHFTQPHWRGGGCHVFTGVSSRTAVVL